MSSRYQAKLPFQKDNEYGFNEIKDISQNIFQNFKMLLLTIPGENIGDDTYGCGLSSNFLFEYDSSTLRSNIENIIRQQTLKYMPYVNLKDFNFEKKDELLFLSIKYYVTDSENTTELTVPISTN